MANITKEERYRRDNPNATPYDLLMAGVITQDRFDELNSKGDGSGIQKPEQMKTQSVKDFVEQSKQPISAKDFAAKSNKLVPTKVIKHQAVPELSDPLPETDRVWLNDKKTGTSTEMSRGAALREQRKYPKRYTIS